MPDSKRSKPSALEVPRGQPAPGTTLRPARDVFALLVQSIENDWLLEASHWPPSVRRRCGPGRVRVARHTSHQGYLTGVELTQVLGVLQRNLATRLPEKGIGERPPLMPIFRWMRQTDSSMPDRCNASCHASTCWYGHVLPLDDGPDGRCAVDVPQATREPACSSRATCDRLNPLEGGALGARLVRHPFALS
jgi:hypothetical protein